MGIRNSRVAEILRETHIVLTTPHGDQKPELVLDLADHIKAHYPSWDQKPGTATNCPPTNETHYPSWGSETPLILCCFSHMNGL